MADQEPTINNNSWPLLQKTFCVITGASRGLGRALAIKIGAKLADDSVLFLLARNVVDLEETKALVLKERRSKVGSLRVHVAGLDLSEPNNETFATCFEKALAAETPAAFKEAIIVHNAGSTGTPMRATQYDDPAEWAAGLAFNVISPVCLNSVFLKTFSAVERKLVINISSLAAIRATPGLSMYCAGKAGRDLYFSTLAAEEPEVAVLNYAPGPLHTEMYYAIIEKSKVTCSGLPTAQEFQQRIDDGLVITCDTTTARLLQILESGRFTSGDHIDYYDER